MMETLESSSSSKSTNVVKKAFTMPRVRLLTTSSNSNKASTLNRNETKLESNSEGRIKQIVRRIIVKRNSGTHQQSNEHNELRHGRVNHQSPEEQRRVAEWKRRFNAENGVPGVIGIRNHGNTCFMNAILQCLSYTDVLAEYLVLDAYKSHVRRNRHWRLLNSLTAHLRHSTQLLATKVNLSHEGGNGNTNAGLKDSPNKSVSTGEVTELLATLMKGLWSLQYEPELSIKLKSAIEKHASQYRGSSQHDAQEFLLWLLDHVHEDTKTKSKNKENEDGLENADWLAAKTSLKNYLGSKKSVVFDVFQAQFRSSLTCPSCQRQSNTFDPFLCVSLPIPIPKKLKHVIVTVVYLDQTPRQVRVGLTLNALNDTIKQLRSMLSVDTGIDEDNMIITSIGPKGFVANYLDSQGVDELLTPTYDSEDAVYCIEVPKPLDNSGLDCDGNHVILSWVNVFKESTIIERRFGSAYAMQISRETHYDDLQKLLMKEMSSILHDDILISAQKIPLFRIRLLNVLETNDADGNYIDPSLDLPLYSEHIDQQLSLCHVSGLVSHLKLVLEWDMPAKTQIVADDGDHVEDHASVRQCLESLKNDEEETEQQVSLEECFALYTSAEKLGANNAWFCPACKEKQEVIKRMDLWSLPDVLVLHLKRFRAPDSKVDMLVDFPLEQFDISKHTANKAEHNNAFYDLYAVCNHHGNDMQGGHYTAFCRNPTDCQWYSFDDVYTKPIEETKIVTRDAYILFYQRRHETTGTAPSSVSSSSSSSSSASSTSSNVNTDHWAYRMPSFVIKKKTNNIATVKNDGDKWRAALTESNSKGKDEFSSPTLESKNKDKDEKSKDVEENKINEVDMFVRNSVVSATLPSVKSKGDNHQSESLAIGRSESLRSLNVSEPIIDDDVSRPIDKNDVD